MDDKAITIITTIRPAKPGGKRAVTVAAAPEGELPLMLTGVFAERHQLADRAFGELLKRKPLAPKGTATKPAGGKGKKAAGKRRKYAAESLPEVEPEADQIGPAVETPAAPSEEALPEIEGDDDGQLEMQLEGSDD